MSIFQHFGLWLGWHILLLFMGAVWGGYFVWALLKEDWDWNSLLHPVAIVLLVIIPLITIIGISWHDISLYKPDTPDINEILRQLH